MVTPQQVLSVFTKTEELLSTVRSLAAELAEENERLRLELAACGEEDLARRLVEIERENETLTNLYVASCQLHGSPELECVVRSIAEVLSGLVGASEYAIFLAEGGDGEFVVVAGEEVEARFPERRLLPGDRLERRVIAEGRPYFGASGTGEERMAVLPMRIGDRAIGAIAIYGMLSHKADAFSSLDRELLNLLAEQGAVAVAAAQALARASMSARGDGVLPG